MVVLIFLVFLLFSVPSFSQEIYTPGNEIDINVSQEYIISPDVMASGGIVANQFDGFIEPDDLPGDYGDLLSDYQQSALDNLGNHSELLGFGEDGYGNTMLDSAFDLITSSTNSTFFGNYGITSRDKMISATNFVPSSIPSSITNRMGSLTGSNVQHTNTHGIHLFGNFSPSEMPYFKLENILPYNPDFKIVWTPRPTNASVSFNQNLHNAFGYLLRGVGWFLLFIRVREIVRIFTEG